jgi:hypothetical protein
MLGGIFQRRQQTSRLVVPDVRSGEPGEASRKTTVCRAPRQSQHQATRMAKTRAATRLQFQSKCSVFSKWGATTGWECSARAAQGSRSGLTSAFSRRSQRTKAAGDCRLQRVVGPQPSQASYLLQQPLVFTVRANPEPNHSVALNNAQGSPVQVDPRGVNWLD